MEYSEDDMLMLSGIQHYMFCPRQWALIHIEQQWEENRLTTEGELLHKNVDNPFYRVKNGDAITLRSVNIASKELGLYGLTDALELRHSGKKENSITHNKYPGYWKPYLVEYKHGHRKTDERDIVQLVAQVMCVEEMYSIIIEYSALFYWETRQKEEIEITHELRDLVRDCANNMHSIMTSRIIPMPIKKTHCNSCSLKDVCLPELCNCTDVKSYLEKNLYEETT